MNLRGKFVTYKDGRFSFQSVKPSGYPIPVTGPVGELLRAQGRHNMRPAHIHFLISKPGYKTQFSQVYSNGDPNLETALAARGVQPVRQVSIDDTWSALRFRPADK